MGYGVPRTAAHLLHQRCCCKFPAMARSRADGSVGADDTPVAPLQCLWTRMDPAWTAYDPYGPVEAPSPRFSVGLQCAALGNDLGIWLGIRLNKPLPVHVGTVPYWMMLDKRLPLHLFKDLQWQGPLRQFHTARHLIWVKVVWIDLLHHHFNSAGSTCTQSPNFNQAPDWRAARRPTISGQWRAVGCTWPWNTHHKPKDLEHLLLIALTDRKTRSNPLNVWGDLARHLSLKLGKSAGSSSIARLHSFSDYLYLQFFPTLGQQRSQRNIVADIESPFWSMFDCCSVAVLNHLSGQWPLGIATSHPYPASATVYCLKLWLPGHASETLATSQSLGPAVPKSQRFYNSSSLTIWGPLTYRFRSSPAWFKPFCIFSPHYDILLH